MSSNEIATKWSILHERYQKHQRKLDVELFCRIDRLLHHIDLSQIKKGFTMLLEHDTSMLCHYLYWSKKEQLELLTSHWQNSEYQKGTESIPIVHTWEEHVIEVEKALLSVLPDYPEWYALYSLGAFSKMEWYAIGAISYRDLSKEMQLWVVKTSREMVRIPAGSFWMGALPDDEYAEDDEKPRHLVHIGKAFYVAKYPVTHALWEFVMEEHFDSSGANRPVDSVRWIDSILFCNRLSVLEGREKVYYNQQSDAITKETNHSHIVMNTEANGYRLLTEAEWEYAARGGVYQLFSGSDDPYEVAGDSKIQSHSKTSTVGLKKSNDFGLFDMTGNVLEWVFDQYSTYTSAEKLDPVISHPELCERVMRGGWFRALERKHWNDAARVSIRASVPPELIIFPIYGFRICRSS